MINARETKIRLHHLAQIDFVIKVRECTKLRHMLIQNKTKTKIFSEHFVMRFCDLKGICDAPFCFVLN